MEPVTLLYYTNESGGHTRRVDWFNAESSFDEIFQRISDELGFTSFELKIKDPCGEFVDFNNHYLTSFRPYPINQQTENPGPQPITSTGPVIRLLIVETSGHHQGSTVTGHRQTPNVKRSMIAHKCPGPTSVAEQPEDEREDTPAPIVSSFICALRPVTLNDKNSAISFQRDLNHTQRDQYGTDRTSAATGKKRGYFVKLQGDKTKLVGKAQNNSVSPMVKVCNNTIPENLTCCLVSEVCEDGRRTFFHHSEREFVDDENEKINQLDLAANDMKCSNTQIKNSLKQTHITIPFNVKMLKKKGGGIKLKTRVIPHAKIRHNDQEHVFCQLTNQYPKGTNYKTSRLAILIEKDGRLLWDQLLLSKAIIFYKSRKNIGYIDINNSAGGCIEQIPVKKGMKRNAEPKQSGPVTECALARKIYKSSTTQTMTSKVNQQMLAVTSINSCNGTSLHNQSSIIAMTYIDQQQNGMTSSDPTSFNVLPVVRAPSSIFYSEIINLLSSPQPVPHETLLATTSSLQNFNTITVQLEPLLHLTDRNNILVDNASQNYDSIMDGIDPDLDIPEDLLQLIETNQDWIHKEIPDIINELWPPDE